MPEATSLDVHKVPANKRVMTCWATTVLPLLIRLAEISEVAKFHVVEDTVLLSPAVSFHNVQEETASSQCVLWGYGNYVTLRGGGVSWFGIKGLTVDPQWCRLMMVVIENMHFTQFKHFDIWLNDRRRSGKIPSIQTLLEPLAGHGYRQSSTDRSGPVFGGAWVPCGLRPSDDAHHG